VESAVLSPAASLSILLSLIFAAVFYFLRRTITCCLGSGPTNRLSQRPHFETSAAWNARDESKAAADECSEADFYRWRQFPAEDIYLGD